MSADQADSLLGPEPKRQGMSGDQADALLGPEPGPPRVSVHDPGGSPETDAYIAQSSLGKVLSAFGQGAESGWGAGNLGLDPQMESALQRVGILPDVKAGQGGILRAFNDALIRPAAAALDGFLRAGSAVAGGATSAAVEAATQIGGEQFGRGVGGLAEATLADIGSRIPEHAPTPALIDAARDNGVIGQGELGWKGLPEPQPESRPTPANENAIAQIPATYGSEALGPSPEPGAFPLVTLPEPTPPPAPLPPPATAAEAARRVAPDTFREYAELAAHRADLSDQIAQQAAALRQSAEAQAPGATEIANLRARMEDATPRLAKKYQDRLDALLPDYEAFLSDDFTLAALSRDTPELAAMRRELQQVDWRMRDLSPDISAAYREAGKHFPAPEEPVAAPSPTAEPTPSGGEAPERPVSSVAASQEQESVANVVPGEMLATGVAKPPTPVIPASAEVSTAPNVTGGPAPTVNIAADVSRKLQAAGRPAEEADEAGQLTEALWRARASAFGGRKGTAEEMYSREAPDIRAGRGGDLPRQPVAEFARKGTPAPKILSLRSPGMYDPPSVRGRAFNEDYGNSRPSSDAEGRLLADVEGRTLRAARIAGRRVVGGTDEGLSAREIADVGADAGAPAKPVTSRKIKGNAGRFTQKVNFETGLFERSIEIDQNLPAPMAEKVLAHEVGHLIDEISGQISTRGLNKELRLIYNDLNNPQKHGRNFGPENSGYKGESIQRELVAEAIRAYLHDPNYLKSVAPKTAATIRASVNDNPRINSIVQFNQGAQGSINLTQDGRGVITLMRAADASTFIHEMGHDWLERMTRDALDPDASDLMRKDAETVHAYLGTKAGEAIPRAAHEKFARSFERYMMEGRAPSRALAGVFAKFAAWLTDIYKTVAKLRAPITPGIRDVFDRMLTTAADRAGAGTAIIPETEAEAQGDLLGGVPRQPSLDSRPREPAEPGGGSPYSAVPKPPERLASFLRRMGGLIDTGGDIRHTLGSAKYRPGLISARGMTLDDAALLAWEHGYFPDAGEAPPDINALLDRLAEDVRGNPQYSANDEARLTAHHEAAERNAEIDRLAAEHGIETKGKTREQFFAAVADKMSEDAARGEIENLAVDAGMAYDEFGETIDAYDADHDESARYDRGEPVSLEDLERERERELAAANQARSVGGGQERGAAGDGAEPGAAGAGQGGHGVGATGRVGRQGGGAGRSSAGGAPGRGDEPGAKPEPLASIPVEGEPPNFRDPGDAEIEKAANIRLDKINGTDDLNQALKALAEKNGDFLDARYGTAAYQTQMDIRSTRLLLRATTSEAAEAGAKAATGDPAAIADYYVKEQRAALVFQHLSSLTADWAHAGHELNRKMAGFDMAKDIGRQIAEGGGDSLRAIQERAAAISQMRTFYQAGKFALDARQTTWQKFRSMLLSYFINNLISGPITHMAYGIGNVTNALYRAIPLPLAQATIGAIRGGADRAYFGEIPAAAYGMMKGARDGIMPALAALKTGIPGTMKSLQGNLGLGPGMVNQVIPGRLGYVLETPSRAVSAIHTFFYSMIYSQEIARLAYRDAAMKGLTGNAFDQAVAQFTSQPPIAAMEAADAMATRNALMRRPAHGSFQQKLVALTNDESPMGTGVKLMIPFMQIGMNILEEGLVETTPLSLLGSEARAELMGLRGSATRDLRIAKIAVGTGIAAAVVGLAAEGLITGGGPADPNLRRVLEDSGWKPYSGRWGDTYIPYRKFLGPLGALVAAAANMHDVYHALGNESLTKVAATLAFGFSEVVADETWMTAVTNFVEAARNWDTKGEQYMRNLAASFIPFSVGLGQVARLVDPYQRQAQTLLDAARNKIPFASEGLRPQIGLWGQPIGSHVMVSPSTATNDPVDARLIALDKGFAPVERQIRGIRLTDAQYVDYAQTAGRLAHTMLSGLVTRPGFTTIPEGEQFRIMTKLMEAARESARTVMMNRYPDILRQALANKQRALVTTH